jgi:hypothetical protein
LVPLVERYSSDGLGAPHFSTTKPAGHYGNGRQFGIVEKDLLAEDLTFLLENIMHGADPLAYFTIALFGATLAFTRPLHFHLFRTGSRLYGSARGGGISRLMVLFGAISLSVVCVWSLFMLCYAVPALRPHMRLCIALTIWCCLSLCILGVACILSWRVKAWLAERGLTLSSFAIIALVTAFILAMAVSPAKVLGQPLVLLLVCAYLASGICVRVVNWLPIIPLDESLRPVRSRNQSARRVVVIVFDELDQRLLFEDRFAGVDLPTIDAFVARALTLENAIPPSRCTEISIPALLTGRMVFETIPIGPNEITLQLSINGPHTPLASQRTIFHDAVDRGYRVGCNVGYHPLDHIFPGLFAAFGWQEAPETELGVEGGWVKSICLQIRSVFETPSFSLFSDTLYGRHSVSRYHRSVVSASSILGDDTLDFVFLHLPVPHPPFIFDRRTDEVTARHARKRSYHDNLSLVDKTLASLLDTIRASSKDRESVVILSSDHWWRHSKKKDLRVPFAVWFSATEPSIKNYLPRRNTVFMKDLVLEILEGSLASAQDIVNWLDSHAHDFVPSKT